MSGTYEKARVTGVFDVGNRPVFLLSDGRVVTQGGIGGDWMDITPPEYVLESRKAPLDRRNRRVIHPRPEQDAEEQEVGEGTPRS